MTNTVKKEIEVKGNKFHLEIYPQREGTDINEFTFEIFPYDYKAALYAFSNKQSLNKLIKEKYITEKK
jgi:methyl coenzyme M reductase subunit D|tara:strand:+ start:590 stop:793 length:204 start_codon:yes stop_codon:yes gene_type:complete